MNIIKQAGRIITKHSPEILTGMGVAGMVTTVVLAVKATPKAIMLLEEYETIELETQGTAFEDSEGHWHDVEIEIPIKTKIKLAWKPYIPAMCMGVVTIACIVGAQHVNSRRTAALASAYSMAELALTEYKDKVVETIGANKEEKIRDEIAKDRIISNPPSPDDLPTEYRKGTLCFDGFSGRYFINDIEKIRQAVNDLNAQMLHEGYIGLNDFYYAIGLGECDLGRIFGWRADNGLIDLHVSAQLTETLEPCLAIDHKVAPQAY